MVMEELIGYFQKSNPDIKSIYVEAIPPGQILTMRCAYSSYLESDRAQVIYEKYGFLGATEQELKLKPLMTQ
jgi:hypothetical protein